MDKLFPLLCFFISIVLSLSVYAGEQKAVGGRISPDHIDDLKEIARSRGNNRVRVIVTFNDNYVSRAATIDTPIDTQTLRQNVRNEVGVTKERAFRSFPGAVYEVTVDELEKLANLPQVLSISHSGFGTADLSTSIVTIGADVAHSGGYTGSGAAIVILDAGVDTNHPDFQGRVVEEACFSTNSHNRNSLCPGGQDVEVGPGSGEYCAGFSRCDHGTHVASIAAGANGVARDANIVSVQIFSEFLDEEGCDGHPGPPPCLRYQRDDAIAALEWVIFDSDTDNIIAVNGSFSENHNQHATPCNQSNYTQPIALLRNAGIAPVFSAGNNASAHSDHLINEPACVGSAIAVSSTGINDEMLTAHNSNALVDIVAPGQNITASQLGGGQTTKTGTSMAAPHVAGAFAVMHSRYPDANLNPVLEWLQMQGVTKIHPDSGLDFQRLDLDAATDLSNYFPYPASCQWNLYYASGGQWYYVEVYQPVGICQVEWKEMYYQNGNLVDIVYK